MRQFVLPPNYNGAEDIRISGADSRYILKVLRLKTGDSFPAVDREGSRYSLQITGCGTGEAGGYFTAAVYPEDGTSGNGCTAGPPGVVLLQCLPKGKKLEMIVRQAVEAGASMIIPVESAHSVARINEERSGKKNVRLQKIAEEAAQQSGNRGVPEISAPVRMKDLPGVLAKLGINGIKLFFHQERLDKGSLHGYLDSSSHEQNQASGRICILIGPEGGISDEETEFLLASGFHPVYLGENVLRTETAAIYALGAVNTILLEKNKWITDIRE